MNEAKLDMIVKQFKIAASGVGEGGCPLRPKGLSVTCHQRCIISFCLQTIR